ncbi:hypothetical protein IID20_03700 [Patescibacteria group bacterium]|nr:hypothetical protein [Patescibacteria group bacterium]
MKKGFKIFTSEPFIFGLILLILLLKFYGLFQAGLLPGWDTIPHQYALKVMAKDFLPDFRLSGYNLNWSAGFPLFQFYPPLVFVLISLIHFLSFKLISLALALRIFVFFSLFLFPLSFYLFVKEFLGKKTAKVGAYFSLFFIFYNYIDQAWFLGAKGNIVIGLFISFFALSLFLLYFAFLEKLRKSPNQTNFLITSLILAGLFLTHTLTSIAAGIFLFIYLLFYHQKKFLKKVILVGLLAFLLASFFLIPFAANLKYTSAEPSYYNQNILQIFFPFKLTEFFGADFNILTFLPLAIFILFLIGLSRLFKEQKFFLPSAFLITFIFLFSDYLFKSFPNLALHYYRFMPFVFCLILAISSYGFIIVLKRLQSKPWLQYTFSILIFLLFFYQIITYNSGLKIKPTEDYPDYHYSLDQYPSASSAREVREYFQTQNFSTRIFIESPSSYSQTIGSTHYFTGLMALDNQKLLNGLYAESNLQTPFISAAVAPISETLIWGQRLSPPDTKFYSQLSFMTSDYLKLFNVGYILAYTEKLKSNLDQYQDVILIKVIDDWQIYRVANPRNLVYQPKYKPGLFIDQDGEIDWSEFADWWYKFPQLLDFPIVESLTSLKDLTQQEVDNFSMLIISAKNLKEKKIKLLRELNHPVVFLNLDSNDYNLNEQFTWIDNLGYKKYSEILAEYLFKEKENYLISVSEPEVKKFTDQEIVFNAQGPVIINAGYFPYWQSINKEQKVYRVTPGQMLVFSDGQTVLHYQSDLVKKISVIVSWLTLLGIIVWLILKPKKNKI